MKTKYFVFGALVLIGALVVSAFSFAAISNSKVQAIPSAGVQSSLALYRQSEWHSGVNSSAIVAKPQIAYYAHAENSSALLAKPQIAYYAHAETSGALTPSLALYRQSEWHSGVNSSAIVAKPQIAYYAHAENSSALLAKSQIAYYAHAETSGALTQSLALYRQSEWHSGPAFVVAHFTAPGR